MPKTAFLWLLAAAVLALTLGAQPASGVTDKEVSRAIAGGKDWLLGQARGGVWPQEDAGFQGGRSCLALLTLATLGEDLESPVMVSGLDAAMRLATEKTYVRAVRAMALAVIARRMDKKSPKLAQVRGALAVDAQWLVNAQGSHGGWNYETMRGHEGRFDFSNTQMAILALWQAALTGIEPPEIVWQRAQKLYFSRQLEDGSYNYGDPANQPGYGSMTAAGLASIYIIADMLDLASGCPCRDSKSGGNPSETEGQLDKAMAWLSAEFSAKGNPKRPGAHDYYWLYAAERAGIATGFRLFGTHDWYKEGAEYLLSRQGQNGAWNNNVVDTCFAALFLYKGRAPILFEKLDCGKARWNSHRRDLANLTEYFQRFEERAYRWQIINLEASMAELHEAPILYISLESVPAFTDAEKKKLRAFTDSGGTVLVEASCGNKAVREWFPKFAEEVWPQWPLKKLDDGHPLFKDPNPLKKHPEVSGIEDGLRTLVFFCGDDISCPWQTKALIAKEYLFLLGVNLYMYATDHAPLKAKPLDEEREERYTSICKPGDTASLRVARLITSGDWMVGSPYQGMEWIRQEVARRADVILEVDDAGSSAANLGNRQAAYLTGTKEFDLDKAQRQALKQYLAGGGFLLAESTGGAAAFDQSLRKLAADMGWELRPVERTAPLMTGRFAKAVGYNVAAGVRFRYALRTVRFDRPRAELVGIYQDGKLVGVYSPLDLVFSSTPCQAYGCKGYQTEDAQAVATNIILYLSDR